MRTSHGLYMLLLATFVIGSAAALSACNTAEGAKRDIKHAGEWVGRKVDEIK